MKMFVQLQAAKKTHLMPARTGASDFQCLDVYN